MRTLSHDPFGRFEIVRDRVSVEHLSTASRTCIWCGQGRQTPSGSHYLYVYGTVQDDRPGHVNWHRGEFCSKPCHDAYHGE